MQPCIDTNGVVFVERLIGLAYDKLPIALERLAGSNQFEE